MNTIHHVFDVHSPRTQVYAALATESGLASWWSTVVRADPRVGGTVRFTFAGDFNPEMEITQLSEGASVEWRCVRGHEPWAENTFRFELLDVQDGTRVRFWQHYATELDDDRYGIYNYNWGYYLESLRLRCETGVGNPFQAAS